MPKATSVILDSCWGSQATYSSCAVVYLTSVFFLLTFTLDLWLLTSDLWAPNSHCDVYARYELAQADLEKGKYLVTEDDLLQQKYDLSLQKLDEFEIRKKKEETYVRSENILLSL